MGRAEPQTHRGRTKGKYRLAFVAFDREEKHAVAITVAMAKCAIWVRSTIA
jgi:hypothetical protein